MPISKKPNSKIKQKITKDPHKALDEVIVNLVDEEDPEEDKVVEELDPEVVEALKIKNKKKKTPTETDYIPELERGEFDFEPAGDDY